MPETKKISLCITTYNRTDLLFKSFEHVINDERIGEVVIVDDCSFENIYDEVAEYCKKFPKIKLYRNQVNLDCYLNKRRAIEYATYPYCALIDSDNIIMIDYLNRVYSYEWSENIIFHPSFAKPNFDYTRYEGLVITKDNVAPYMSMPMFSTMLNTNNFFVNRNRYLETFDDKVDPVTSDSIYFCYCWLAAGNEIFVVNDLSYFHLVHSLSHYQNNVSRTNGFHEHTERKLKELI